MPVGQITGTDVSRSSLEHNIYVNRLGHRGRYKRVKSQEQI